MDFARRAARNEEMVREVNRGIEERAERDGNPSVISFNCECAQTLCLETIELEPQMYETILSARYRFVVVPEHVQAEVERIVETHDSFVVVEKVGEAREQLDRDHPQRRHAGTE